MPRLLTATDLAPLLADRQQVDRLLDAVSSVYREQAAHPGGRAPWLEAPSATGGKLMAFSDAFAGRWTILRVDPHFQQTRRAPNSSRAVLVFDADEQLRAIVEGNVLYELRIAAATAVAARALLQGTPRTLALLGTGAEAGPHLRLILHVAPSITDVRVWSPTPEHRTALVRAEQPRSTASVAAVDSAQTAVDGAEVVLALTSASQPVFSAEWLQPGALVLAIARGQIPGSLVSQARLIVSAQAMFQRGGGRTRPDPNRALAPEWDQVEPAGDLADVLTGRIPPRASPDELVLFQLVGLPGMDAAVMAALVEAAEQRGLGTPFHFG